MHHMNQYRIMVSIHMPAARNNNEYIIGIVIAINIIIIFHIASPSSSASSLHAHTHSHI